MLKQRFLTALVLVPVVLLAIYLGNIWVLAAMVWLLVMGCGFEWLQLIPIRSSIHKVIFLLSLSLCIAISYYCMPWSLVFGLSIWAAILPMVIFYPLSEKIWGKPTVVAIASLILLPVFAVSLFLLYQQEQGADLIVYLLCLVWATDIGAYFAGKLWGTHKLIPQVSPGKTIEGALGGIAFAMVVALGGYIYFNPYSNLSWFIIALVVILISMLGDLFISMLKRRSQVKDTGTIFPGHGGVLDRLDSLIAAAPLFYFGLRYLSPGL